MLSTIFDKRIRPKTGPVLAVRSAFTPDQKGIRNMPKEYYIRTLTAGRYVKVVRYSRAVPNDTKSTRQHKQAATNAAQKFINIKNATERLQLLLCANFDSKDACFCTFTFRADQLPANQKHTKAIFCDYLKKIRAEWRRKGQILKYIYTIEGEPMATDASTFPGSSHRWETEPWKDRERWAKLDCREVQGDPEQPTRLHVHCFLLLKKGDYEAVRALWPYGQVYINQMKVNELTTFSRLASYVTKEKRADIKGNGARAYTPSLGLDQPESTGHWCTEYEGITLPKGADEIKSGAEHDEIYGTSMEYIFYRLPRAQQTPQPYKSRGPIGSPPRSKQRK